MTPTLFQLKHQEMRRAARSASVALLQESDGYLALGPCAEKVANVLISDQVHLSTLLDGYKQAVIPLNVMDKAVNKLSESGLSVALLDRYQPDLKVKPTMVLICTVGAKKPEEDFC